MDALKCFKVVRVAIHGSCTIAFGKIDGRDAIYIVPLPTLPSPNIQNAVLNADGSAKIKWLFSPRLIYPATKKHIDKYTENGVCLTESYGEYLAKQDFLQTSWLDNIIAQANGKPTTHRAEELLFENDSHLIIHDYKWNRQSVDNLYLLSIFKNDCYRSIRDLDCPELLEDVKEDILRLCKERYGLDASSLCIYFHYRPSYFRLHIHIVNISKSVSFLADISRNILLDDVIKNLKMDLLYYKRDCKIITIRSEAKLDLQQDTS